MVQRHPSVQISYLFVLRAVGRSAGTQPNHKIRIRQLVSSTILIFLICFSPYHLMLLIRTLLERDCAFIAGVLPLRVNGLGCKGLWLWSLWCCCVAGIFNYYHLSLLLTSLNCLADPALYCFVSESARRGLYRAVFTPVGRILFCCRHHGNVSSGNHVTESHEVATEENNGHPTVMLLTHIKDTKPDTIRKTAIWWRDTEAGRRAAKMITWSSHAAETPVSGGPIARTYTTIKYHGFRDAHITLLCCIYLPHLNGRSLKIR